mmetsp:Transcript_17104/g.25531  ORF Transcript_17104/g.25531 Transcript_17104/m.25531 type:complete len:411 (+) Transcript_17104:13-1245(+)
MTQSPLSVQALVPQAIRPKRRSDDIFFIDGDRLALQSSDAIAISYVEERYEDEEEDIKNGSTKNTKNSNSSDDNRQEEEEQQPNTQTKLWFPCSSPHCNEVFDTIAESQRHYEEKHCFQCIECNSVYPNEHLLDLHIEETHDAYFQLSLERQRRQEQNSSLDSGGGYYKCLVMGCQSTFQSDKERCYHLRHVHDYPNWFRFHSRRKERNDSVENIKIRTTTAIGERGSLYKTKQWWHNKRKKFSNSTPADDGNGNGNDSKNDHNYNENSNNYDNDNEDENMIPVEDVVHHDKDKAKQQKLKNKMQERKERKKKSNASIPCRFYNSKGGCWRGDNCMFLHVSSTTIETKSNISKPKSSLNGTKSHRNNTYAESPQSMDICEEIDSLANQMKAKAKISVPNNISFGRRRRNY